MPVAEGLHLAMQLAEQLRQIHDLGAAHGGLTPATISLSGNAVQLLGPEAGLTAYSAPEVRRGVPPDARSDIFSFGAIMFEMLTGRPAFEGGAEAGPLESGSDPIDRLVNGCVALFPDSRYQRIQKVILELRLLLSWAKRLSPAAVLPAHTPAARTAPALPPSPAAPADASASAIGELESRISARLAEQERTIASIAQVANEVLKAVRDQQVTAPRGLALAPPPPRAHAEAAYSHAEEFQAPSPAPIRGDRTDRLIDLLSDKVSRMDLMVSNVVDRIQKLENIFDQFDIDAAALRDSVTKDIRGFERALKAQSTAIESARTAMGQTDDLVERVVEALDSLQAMVVTSSEERTSLAS